MDENQVAIPSLLAVSALQQYLVRTKKRTSLSIVLESAEPREVHHFATLLGYGAAAINPYLAQECIEELINKKLLDKAPTVAIDDYNQAILNGVVKIASKMGISTIQSYLSAQIFEAVGISSEVIDEYFTNTVSRVGGHRPEGDRRRGGMAAQPRLRPLGTEHRHHPGLPPVSTRPGRVTAPRIICTTPKPSPCSSRRCAPATMNATSSILRKWITRRCLTPSGG